MLKPLVQYNYSVKCTNCGAMPKVSNLLDFMKCEYCGAGIKLVEDPHGEDMANRTDIEKVKVKPLPGLDKTEKFLIGFVLFGIALMITVKIIMVFRIY